MGNIDLVEVHIFAGIVGSMIAQCCATFIMLRRLRTLIYLDVADFIVRWRKETPPRGGEGKRPALHIVNAGD